MAVQNRDHYWDQGNLSMRQSVVASLILQVWNILDWDRRSLWESDTLLTSEMAPNQERDQDVVQDSQGQKLAHEEGNRSLPDWDVIVERSQKQPTQVALEPFVAALEIEGTDGCAAEMGLR